jgi:hypothetical protein
MELSEFAEKQIIAVEKTAQGLSRLLEINGSYDYMGGAANCIKNNPWLKGVSVWELTHEMFAPGTFRAKSGGNE